MKELQKVTPASAEWTYLAFQAIELAPGESATHSEADREQAVVPLAGPATLAFDGQEHSVSRSSVFEHLAAVGYVPPGIDITVTAGDSPFTYAVGSAPAEGRYAAKLVPPSVIRSEVRGGGMALRQVNHTLAMPIEAERLILYEVYVPRGTWSGWPPHCHDGLDGSPYLEEVYYFRMDRPEGYWMHRNWRDNGPDGDHFNDLWSGGDGDLALVPRGYHSSVACPGANMYFLNYLAGELEGDDRRTPPCFHSDHTWIEQDWSAGTWGLPVVTNGDVRD
ncbi:MAG: 5-deoxy-glucuronate isomerase [Acidimicrobiales bacterium]|nr:5-deoxy-glucuronate isomerase [Acidimicrobiales bacterium]